MNRKLSLKLILISLPLLLAFRPVTFEPEVFSWTPPTQYVDGTPLPPADVQSYALDCAKAGGGTFANPSIPPSSSWAVPPKTFGEGTWTCILTVTATNNKTSGASNAVEFEVAKFVFTVLPSPPSGLAVG